MITRSLQGLVCLVGLVAGIWYTFYVPARLGNVVTVLLGSCVLLDGATRAGQLLDCLPSR